MSQNRDNLPWFPMYSNNMISDKRYRLMSPLERALWISILMECWSNGSVPADPAALARWLGWSDEDVKDGLTERVRSFFSEVEGEFISPQLEEHHKKQMRRRTGLSDGGKKGAERRWKKKQSEDEMAGSMTSPITSPSETDKSIASPLTSSIASFNTIKLNSIKSNSVFKEEDLRDDWLDGYDSVPEQETVISNQEKVRVRV